MKALLLSAALMLAALTTKTFAADVKVAPVVLQTFHSTFFNVSNVHWSKVDNLYKAEFDKDGEKTAAFFSIEDGTLVATARYITVQDLPRALRNSLKQQAATASITELFEVQGSNDIDYYATLQEAGKTIVLKAAAAKWNVYKK